MDKINHIQKVLDEVANIGLFENTNDKINASKEVYNLLAEYPLNRTLSPKNQIEKSIFLALAFLEIGILEATLFDKVIYKALFNIEVAYSELVKQIEVII